MADDRQSTPLTASRPAGGAELRGPAVAARDRRVPAWVLGAGGVLFAVSVAVLIIVFRSFPRQLLSMLDLHVYLWGGRLVRRSGDPYGPKFGKTNLYFTYTPMAAGFFALAAGIKLHTAKLLMTAASLASLVAAVWLTWGALRYRRSAGRLGATLAVAALALWIEPVQQTLAFGQVNLGLMFIIVADLCLPESCWLKGAGVGVAAGFKLTPLIFIPYLMLTRRFRAAGVATATFVLTIAGSFLLMPKAAHQYWSGNLFSNAQRLGNIAYVGNQSLNGALLRLLGGAAAARPYWLAAAAVVGAAGLVLAAWASRRGHEMIGILTCALTGLLVSPVSWSHHWVWIAPILVVLADLALRPGSLPASRLRRRAGWLGGLAVGALYFAYPLHRAPGTARLPAGLIWTVSGPAVQGTDMDGLQQLIGDLYPLAALAALAVIAAMLALPATGRGRALRAEPVAHAGLGQQVPRP